MRAVFLDRDGVINLDRDYIYRIEHLRLIKGSAEGLLKLQKRGFLLVIITNQSGIGRGLYKELHYLNLREALNLRLKKKGIKISAEYYCPHAPEDKCRCRKPSIYFIKKAEKELGINLKESYFIGDKTSDILAGKKAGMKTVLVRTGKGGKDGLYDVTPDYVCDNLLESSKIIK